MYEEVMVWHCLKHFNGKASVPGDATGPG